MGEEMNLEKVLAEAKETIGVLRGMVEMLDGNLQQALEERDELAEAAVSLQEENDKLQESLLQRESRGQTSAEAGEICRALGEKLAPYYKDMALYNEKHITAEDGEMLYNTLQYTFKQMKKAGVKF